jgi:Methyltransferase domain
MIDVKQVVRGLVAVAVALSLVAASASAQAVPAQTAPAPAAPAQPVPDTQKPYEPTVSQAGKDVVWVPTPQATVDNMLLLAKLTPQDYLIDLGSGDGITVISAAKKGARAHGVEFNPDMVALSQRKAKEAGVADKATFAQGDLFEADLSKATVITLFLLPTINTKLRPALLELKPGTRIVSNTFDMGDWQSDAEASSEACTSWCKALLWVVPAKVAGTWRLGDQTLTLTQQYQIVGGTLGSTPITVGKLKGDVLTFTAGGRTYAGRVNGDRITGSGWSATRANGQAPSAAAGRP